MAVLAGTNSTTGLTTQGQVQSNSGETWQGEQYTVAVSGNATSLWIYSHWNHSDNIKLALVDAAGNVLAVTADILVQPAGSAGWLSGAISSTAITASDIIYVMAAGDAADTGRIPVMTNGSATGTYEATDGSRTSPPATMSLSVNGGNAFMTMYVDGTASGGSTGRSRMIGGKLVGGILVR
jgi:hypothetical protein